MQKRPWYKGARGYYEKPSTRRHKQRYVERLKRMASGQFRHLSMQTSLPRQLLRSDPYRGVWTPKRDKRRKPA